MKSLTVIGLSILGLLCCGSLAAQTYPMNQQDPAASGFSTSIYPLYYRFGWRFKSNAGDINVLRLGTNSSGGLLATLYPAVRASLTTPITALGHE